MSLIICKASATLKIYNLIIGVLIKVYFLQMVIISKTLTGK